MSRADELRERLASILIDALSGTEERYRYVKGGVSYVRWALVDQDIKAAAGAALEAAEAEIERLRKALVDHALVENAESHSFCGHHECYECGATIAAYFPIEQMEHGPDCLVATALSAVAPKTREGATE